MSPNLHKVRTVVRTNANKTATKYAVPGGVLLVASLLAAAVLGAQAGRKVTGIVVAAATEQPVTNAPVQYAGQDGSMQTTMTDAKGQFEFSAGQLGVVTVTADGFGTARQRWPPRRGSTLHIALTPPVTVRGTLVDSETLQPLAGVVTALVRHSNNFVSTSAFVEEDGTFQFEDVPSALGVLMACANGYAPTTSSFTTVAGDWWDAQIRLSADAEATGQVLDAAAKPVAGAQLVVRYADTLAEGLMLTSFVGGTTITRTDGTFALKALVPNTPITLHAEYDGQRTNTVTVEKTNTAAIEVGPGQVLSDLVLRLP